MKLYKIADFIFGVHMDESLDITENFKKFVIDTDEEVQVEYFLSKSLKSHLLPKIYKLNILLKSLMNFQNHRANVLLHEMICRYFKMGILKAGA